MTSGIGAVADRSKSFTRWRQRTGLLRMSPDPISSRLATRSLQRIDDTLGGLAAERSRLDHGDARGRALRREIGTPDFAGS